MKTATYDENEWRLMPLEATTEMLRAAQQAWGNDPLKRTSTLYAAMWCAAPEHTPIDNLKHPLTPYGSLVRSLRTIAGVTLMEMAQGIGETPAWLSGIETGRKPLGQSVIRRTHAFFVCNGVPVTLELLVNASRDRLVDL